MYVNGVISIAMNEMCSSTTTHSIAGSGVTDLLGGVQLSTAILTYTQQGSGQ